MGQRWAGRSEQAALSAGFYIGAPALRFGFLVQTGDNLFDYADIVCFDVAGFMKAGMIAGVRDRKRSAFRADAADFQMSNHIPFTGCIGRFNLDALPSESKCLLVNRSASRKHMHLVMCGLDGEKIAAQFGVPRHGLPVDIIL